MSKIFDHQSLKKWFLEEKRDLPWRNTPSPYAVWVSEVMLQQTQVAVVIPYFNRWMQRYPTIEALAAANLDEVLKVWEGLGYYSRARNLHEGACYVVKHFKGQLPSKREELEKIKGLGPYTIGAILSFAFHQKTAAVDGNVIRVLARYHKIEDDISKATTVKTIRNLAEECLPEQEPWVIAEAMIELGATVCNRNPRCNECPLQRTCKGYRDGIAEQLPYKTKKVKVEILYRAVAVIVNGDKILIQRGEKGKIMSDLHEFPYFSTTEKGISQNHFMKKVGTEFDLDITSSQPLSSESQSFTRYRVHLSPWLLTCKSTKPVQGMQWLTHAELKKLAFSSGHRRIYEKINNL